jgi:hypothetical protein
MELLKDVENLKKAIKKIKCCVLGYTQVNGVNTIPNYADAATANGDAALAAGKYYTVTSGGAKQLYVK